MSHRPLAQGAVWMVAMRWVIRLIGLVNSVIIARLLTPGDFGVVALAMIAVDLCVTAIDGDIDMALIRTASLDQSRRHTGWSLKLIGGLVVGLALWLIAPLIAAAFAEPRLIWLIRIAALRPVILGCENIAVIEFRRSLDFAAEFRYLVAQKLLSFLLCLAIIGWLRSALALALCAPVTALVTVALSYRFAPADYGLCFRHWPEFWAFSRWQMLFNLSRCWGERLDPLLIGRWGDLTQTGLYAVGLDLALLPSGEIILPAGRALMPGYARLASDQGGLRQAFHGNLQVSLLVGAACGVGLACVADDAVVALFGTPWRAAAPWVAWLALYGALEGIWLMLDPLLIASGQERLLGLANLGLAALLSASALLCASQFGVAWLPLGRIAAMLLALAVMVGQLVRLDWLDYRTLLAALWRPLLASLGMALVIRALHPDQAGSLISLLHDIGIGAVSFTLIDLALWRLAGSPPGAEAAVMALLPGRR
jgi:O-antigen/teichoic acid export membrane protein